MNTSTQTESNATAVPFPKADQIRKMIGINELAKDIYAKLDSIQSVIGYLLAKTKDLPEPVVEEPIVELPVE